jgi:hypothetical protein
MVLIFPEMTFAPVRRGNFFARRRELHFIGSLGKAGHVRVLRLGGRAEFEGWHGCNPRGGIRLQDDCLLAELDCPQTTAPDFLVKRVAANAVSGAKLAYGKGLPAREVGRLLGFLVIIGFHFRLTVGN